MILDTNAVSALADGEPGVVAQCARVNETAIPVIVLGEFRYGIAQSRHRRQYERWLSELLDVVQVLGINEETAVRYADLRLELQKVRQPTAGKRRVGCRLVPPVCPTDLKSRPAL